MSEGLPPINYRASVDAALHLLRDGLRPFVEREYEAQYGLGWGAEADRVLAEAGSRAGNDTELDVAALVTLVLGRWKQIFNRKLRRSEYSLLVELREERNRWAHQYAFDWDDCYRVHDRAFQLLTAISAREAEELFGRKQELRHQPPGVELGHRKPEQTPSAGEVADLEARLFELEHSHTHTAEERDQLRRELARQLNNAPVELSAEDRELLQSTVIDPAQIFRPRVVGLGLAELHIERSVGSMSASGNSTIWDDDHVESVADQDSPFGLLYPRWQYPNNAGAIGEAGGLWTPFIILEHPKPGTWIATTVAEDLGNGVLRHSRELFEYDRVLGLWHRTVEEHEMRPSELVLADRAARAQVTTSELNEAVRSWLYHWLPLIEDTL